MRSLYYSAFYFLKQSFLPGYMPEFETDAIEELPRFYRGQKQEYAHPSEYQLIRNSPNREVLKITIETFQGKIFDSPIIYGTQSGVSSLEEIHQLISNLRSRTLKERCLIKRIIITHTHIHHEQKGEYRILSKKDNQVLENLSRYFFEVLEMRAITKSGFRFSLTINH